MSSPSRFPAFAWWSMLLLACGLLAWASLQRAQRVEQVSRTDAEAAIVDPASPTGYAGGKRWLIVPEHNNRSYQWIAETQQMLARGEWRVRHVDYENVPLGREVYSASPYRWWLGLVARGHQLLSGQPIGLAVERAALWADPLLLLLLLASTTIFVAAQWGAGPATLLAAGMCTLYPFTAGFLPGVPGDRGLALACALWSVLPLLAWTSPDQPAGQPRPGRTPRLFLLAGVAGGLGLWVDPAVEAPLLAGLALGGLVATWLGVGGGDARWRIWGLAGAVTCLAAYLVEYFPGHLDLHLQVNHPLYGVTWLGAAELLNQFEAWSRQRNSFWNLRRAAGLLPAVAALAAIPAGLKLGATPLLLGGDLLSSRLTSLPNGVVAKNFATWLVRDGPTGAVAATCLPLLLLAPALWLLARRQTDIAARRGIAVALGPVLVAFILAAQHLAWWTACDAMLLALLVATAAAGLPAIGSGRQRWLWFGGAGMIFVVGAVQLVPTGKPGGGLEFTRLEVEALIERGLAHWIADHAGPGRAVILVPPDRTTSWCFHGGLRGLGTANWENREGLAATVRIVTATSADEARALIDKHGVTHLVLPSWDTDLNEFARWSLKNPNDAFIAAVQHWALPPWLAPVPYTLPVVAGFEGQSVTILAVSGDSSRAVALSRLAEYFVEMQRTEMAASSAEALRRYPADLAALIALAQVERARGNAAGFDQAFQALVAALTGGLDRTLAWDRRVSLAIVLALGERNDLAREQVRRCLDRLDETRIRSLTTGSLFRLQVLARAFGLEIKEPALRELAASLLPAELRQRLSGN